MLTKYIPKILLIQILAVAIVCVTYGVDNIITSMVFLLGMLLFLLGYFSRKYLICSKRWVTVQAEVMSISIFEEDEPGAPCWIHYYVPNVEFEYQYNEIKYRSKKIALCPDDYRDVDRLVVEEFLSQFPTGSYVDAYCNPDDATQAVLLVTILPKRRNHFLALMGAGILLMILGGAVLYIS